MRLFKPLLFLPMIKHKGDMFMSLRKKTGGRQKGTPNKSREFTELKKKYLQKIDEIISSAEGNAREKKDGIFCPGLVYFSADEKFLLKILSSLVSSV
jgi:hypothetical protein